MSRRTQERHQPEKIQTQSNPLIKKILIYLAIIVLAGVPFIYGKYFELNYPDPYDSGSYVYSAKHVLEGAVIGVSEIPGAKMGTLFVNMLGVKLTGFNEIGAKLMQGLFQLIALVLMFLSLRKIYGRLAAAVAIVIASLYLSAPLIAKFGNVKEQHMVAFMVISASCFVLRQSGGKWIWAILCGAFGAWAPLFKETGSSVIAAIGLFLILQPFLKHRTWKQTFGDIGLILAGAVLSLIPVYIWLWKVGTPINYWPYRFVLEFFKGGTSGAGGSYISEAKKLITFDEQALRVLRYYGLLMLPILAAFAAILVRLVRFVMSLSGKLAADKKKNYERFVLLFAVWWILDMAFVWISPRSYEQYYIPLNASAAMLGAYIFALYSDSFEASQNKIKWSVLGFIGAIMMIVLSQHIIFGVRHSPHSGQDYGELSRGYVQKCEEIKNYRSGNFQGPWEVLGEYIKNNSVPSDKIYVWGWYPGIYVKAERFSATAAAVTSEMHVMSPQALAEMINNMIADFKKQPPKFIVDSYKRDFPWTRPPLELWPQVQGKFLPNKPEYVSQYENAYSQVLSQKIGEEEARRFEAMKPFRDFVMNNYKVANKYGEHVLFELKADAEIK
jgi:hypothetical protein